ncbi:MAG: mercuric reductase [Aureliella sp.]
MKALEPLDQHNQTLAQNVHPEDWSNPEPSQPYHLVVIGAGTAGLVTAAGAAGLGARVALIERELMGGDCLNVGCVPSKGILHAARVAATVRDAAELAPDDRRQSDGHGASVSFEKAMERMRKLRAQISPADSAARFRDLGVDVYFGQGSFESNGTIQVTRQNGETRTLSYKKAVIASGARASAPPIPGLEEVDYLTNETVFSLTELPKRMGIIGSGPIGSEMAQAFARLGSDVVLFERNGHVLPREDPEAGRIVGEQLERDGVRMVLHASDMQIRSEGVQKLVSVTQRNAQEDREEYSVDQLLVAVGRAPYVDELNLQAVGVDFGREGVQVNDHLQTTNPNIYAAGDVCSRFKFTHAADFMARIVIQNALFALGPFGRKKASDLLIPWATYTSPEVAHVGVYGHEAEGSVDTYVQSMSHVDRAILDGQDEGFVKVHTKKGTDQIVGATIVAENAGDLISELTVAMKHGIGLGKIASTIHPYPTQGEAIRKLGDQFNRTKLTPTSKGILRRLLRWNVGA